MKKILKILTVQSIRELFRYKSFFLLIFLLFFVDRALHSFMDNHRELFSVDMAEMKTLGLKAAPWVFEKLPPIILDKILDYRLLAAMAILFLFKQFISLWPSSDMRRIHRRERKSFGFINSLFALKLSQVTWDALALACLFLITGLWATISFLLCSFFWTISPVSLWLILLAFLLLLPVPVVMGGLSFSSKLAVLSRGSFKEKMKLYLKLFTNRNILLATWIFFVFRLTLEFLFVAALPLASLLLIDHFGTRILVSALLATPVYSFLKMASFKFFLEVYQDYPHVVAEYEDYYQFGRNP